MLHINLAGGHSWRVGGLPSPGGCEPTVDSPAMTRTLAARSIASSSWISVVMSGGSG